jgi:Terminase RNaseH-like domain
MTSPRDPGGPPATAPISAVYGALMYADFEFFMSQLVELGGQLLSVAPHHRPWCRLVTSHRRVVLLAPRDHGKSYLLLSYVAWQFWRHGRDPRTGRPVSADPGRFLAILFSATHDQARILFSRFRDLLVANEWLFGDVVPHGGPAQRRLQLRWERTGVRLANGAEFQLRAFGTSTRGMHPDLLVLDDVLWDGNSASSHKREATWKYFNGTVLPMHPRRLIMVGTAQHRDDLLHRLGPGGSGDEVGGTNAVSGFVWRRDRALDLVTETALWPERHPMEELLELRAREPTNFSREYQNDPRDDAASIFPYELTQRALDAGALLTFPSLYRRNPNEYIVMGVDPAVSEAAGADYTVMMVVAFNAATGFRLVLAGRQVKGLGLREQADLICELCERYGVQVVMLENNGFQQWLVDELETRPEARGRVYGNRTGRQKLDLIEGVLRLKNILLADRWIMPCGDAESRHFAKAWQNEHAAYGWRDGRLEGVGEHDDTVDATWLVEVGIRKIEHELAELSRQDEIITLEDLGIKRVQIGEPYPSDPLDELRRYLDELRYG